MPRGCSRSKTIGEIAQSYDLWCFELTREQGNTVRTLAKFFPGLTVSAPSYRICQPLSTETDCNDQPHHLGTTAVDFSSNHKSEILKAFLTLSPVWGGGLGIGLWQSGKYSAQLHLHVDGRMGDGRYNRWIETQLSADKKMLASVIPADEIVYQRLPDLKIIKREKKPGIWKKTLADAASIYGYTGGADQAIIEQIKGSDRKPAITADSLPLVGGVLGAALGYQREGGHTGNRDWLKLGLYTGAGIAIGTFIRELKKGVDLWSGGQ